MKKRWILWICVLSSLAGCGIVEENIDNEPFLSGVPVQVLPAEIEPIESHLPLYSMLDHYNTCGYFKDFVIFEIKEPLNNSHYPVPTRCISRHLPLVKVISA